MLSKEFDLPQYELSPYEIFADRITVLDVNFFNPKPNEPIGVTTYYGYESINLTSRYSGTNVSNDGRGQGSGNALDTVNGDKGCEMSSQSYDTLKMIMECKQPKMDRHKTLDLEQIIQNMIGYMIMKNIEWL